MYPVQGLVVEASNNAISLKLHNTTEWDDNEVEANVPKCPDMVESVTAHTYYVFPLIFFYILGNNAMFRITK